jgi:hypothetical protein
VRKVLGSLGKLVSETVHDPTCAIKFEPLGLGGDQLVQNMSGSGLGQLPVREIREKDDKNKQSRLYRTEMGSFHEKNGRISHPGR